MSTCPKRIRALSLFAAIALALGFTLLSQEGVAYAADGQDTLTSASLATQEGPEAEAVELAITNNTQTFEVSGATLESVGVPNSNNYKANLVLTMGSDSYDAAFVGKCAEAAEAASVIAFDGGASTFTVPVKWVATFGKPETLVTLCNGEPFFMSLRSKADSNWSEYKVALDETAGTLVLDLVKKDQTITASDIAKTYGDAAFSLGAKTSGDGALTYAVTSGSNVSVDAAGKVTVKGAGTATITVTAAETANYKKATKAVKITVAKKAQTITASDIKKTFGGAAFALGAKANGKLTYTTNNAKVATIDAAGKVTIKGAGAATITLTAAETANYKKATKTIKITIAKKAQAIVAANKAVTMGKTVSLAAKASGNGVLSYKSSNTKVIKVNSKGVVKPVNVGTAQITITASATTNYAKATKTVTVKVRRGTQGIAFANQTKAVKLSKVKRASQVVAISKATKAKTAVTYSITKVSKSKASFSIDKKTGKITVKKGLKKGTYKVTVKATAAKTANYKAAAKSAVITINVK